MTVVAMRADASSILAELASDLGVTPVEGSDGRLELVAAVMRRLAGVLCPCPRAALKLAVLKSLDRLVQWTDELEWRTEAAIEGALVGGDLLELANVVIAEEHEQPTWLYCAPPGFVRGPGARLYILGIPPDGALFLPTGVRERLRHQGSARFVDEQLNEGLAETLTSLGLREIKPDVWRHARRPEIAANHIATLRRKLEREGATGTIAELRVLRPASTPGTAYTSRWMAPDKGSGLRVGRFAGGFGNRIWCLVELEQGEVKRYLRLPLRDSALAPSDAAWLAQLALDAFAGQPGTYRCAPRDDGVVIICSFPLPRFARRRFEYIDGGTTALAPYAFWVPDAQRIAEEAFLREQLWLMPAQP
ncbi:hypothetical protein GmRootV213_28850 [Variovorax sp. V213]|uniref:hypothetical protein n=1 Tax=Variovorax sp. V213 TaxID=3065955 RepID=UPI0034E8739F